MSRERKRRPARGARVVIAAGATAAVAATMALDQHRQRRREEREAGRHAPVRLQRAGRARQQERDLQARCRPRCKKIYSSDPGALNASPWAHSKPVKGPWKIGYIAFAITNPYNQHVLDGLKTQFAEAKTKGLVTGSLITNIPATIAASTPEQEIAAVQQMVRQGVNAIIMEPIAGDPVVPAIDAAGKAGVPVILTDIPLPADEVRHRRVVAEPDRGRRRHARADPEGQRPDRPRPRRATRTTSSSTTRRSRT